MLRQLVLLWLTLLTINLYSQDEGLIERKARFERPHSIAVQIGPQFRLGKADYTGGYSISLAYTNKVNRMLSIGTSIAYTRFAFQPSYANSYENGNGKGNNIFQGYNKNDDQYEYFVYVVHMLGGNINQFSLGLKTRFDFIPVKADKKVSVYGVAEPFLLVSNRSEVTATTYLWYVDEIPYEDPKSWNPDNRVLYEELGPDSPGHSHWANKTEFAGGINIGLGIEINLPTHWKFCVQPTLRYTLPVTHIKTANYPALNEGNSYNSPKYPFAKESFTSVGVLLGIAHNF